MADTARTFIAVPIPEGIADTLAGLRTELEPGLRGLSWVAPRNLHVTLAFLGDVEAAEIASIGRAVAEAASELEPFDLQVHGLGTFPSPSRARVLWAGLAGPGLPTLHALHESVLRGLTRLGRRPDDQRFAPHVTLARFRPGRGRASRPPDLGGLVDRFAGWSGGEFRAAEAVVFGSTLGPEGPAYSPLARGFLGR